MLGKKFIEHINFKENFKKYHNRIYRKKYGTLSITIAILLLVITVRLLLTPLVEGRILFVFFVFPVVAAAWYFGMRGGLLMIITGLVVGDFIFLYPRFTFGKIHTPEATLATLFILNGTFLSYVSSLGKKYYTNSQKLAEAEKIARINGQRALDYRDNFLSFASHELKTPLTISMLYLQVFENKLKKDDKNNYDADITKVKEQIGKIKSVTDKLLNVSNISAGMIKLNYTKFDLSDCINEATELAKLIKTNHQIKIVGTQNITVSADREKILQCLLNLMTNAKIYSPKAKTINVSVSSDQDRVLISVEDFGIGIPESEQKKIFKRFYKPRESHTYPGIGIGLYFVRKIIYRHKGRIWVESEYNKGSKFSFSLLNI